MDDTLIRILQLGKQGFYCSQIMIILALEAKGEDNPALVRSLSGLAYGCGGGRSTCGVLTGAACLVAYYAGRGSDQEEESPKMPLMLQELSDWFEEHVGQKHGGVTCEAIVGQEGPQAARQRCGNILVETYNQTLRILAENGFEFI
jgi:C_GCAxxG_C_C family probable redox protein